MENEILMEWREPLFKSLPDGKHKGKIVDIKQRVEPYEYTDVVIEVIKEDSPVQIWYSAPSALSTQSKLGRLIMTFKHKPEVGMIDIRKLLVGKEVEFMTITKTRNDKTFSEIVEDSVKPIENKNEEELVSEN